MVLCIIALIVFSIMSIFSVRYRVLAKQAFRCVFLKMTFRPCESGLDQKIKMSIVSTIFDHSPRSAKFLNKHFELLSWIFVILSIASFVLVAQGAYNIYLYGSCDPLHPEQCLITGVIGQPICPNSFDGINVGPANAKVLIIEFGCFTCKYTAQYENEVHDILAKYNNSVRYVFKTFPIPTHDNSREAAAASVCANNQGKYWEYREAIFANQPRVISEGKPYLISLASDNGLNSSLFSKCITDPATISQIDLMQEQGIESKVYGTPTFFVNHRYVANPADLETFVKEELAK